MSTMKQIFLILSLSLLAIGCGSSSKGKKPTTKNDDSVSDPYIQSLMGTWTRTCTQGQKIVANVSATTMNVSADIYSDANCSEPAISMTSSAGYTPGEAYKSQANAKPISFEYGAVNLVPKSKTIADLMNKGKVCGFTDWTSGSGKAIKVDSTNCQNADFGEFKALQNQIFQVEGNVLKVFRANGSASNPGVIFSKS